ncbi:MAG TPA: Ig-like domain-containing protein, partial [Gemmatimonadaceae bacterium]|nr:Ig-like domain-containing protein [Gemmatimonadaceae bacterium]
MKRISVAAAGAALAIGAACSDHSPSAPVDTTSILPRGFVVSNAQVNVGTASPVASGSVAASSSLNIATGLAYVSAVPGTFPSATTATVRNQTRSGASRLIPIIDGGIDPVGIEAAAGDELALTLLSPGGGAIQMTVVVPPRRPPGVVRTNPSKGRSDVAMNVQVVVVFSEPIDVSTVTASSIALQENGNAVRGHVQLSADGLSAEFIPDGLLQPQTRYTLVINTGIRDMDGDALG